jgi:hypothetical protein
MRSLVSLLAVVAALLAPAAALATLARWMELPELLSASEVVVRARVLSQREVTVAQGEKPRTDTTLEVLQRYKGTAGDRIVVRQIAGHVGDAFTAVAGDARFTKGEEVVVFLYASRETPGIHFLTALAQSKFTVERGAQGALLHRDLSDLGIVAGGQVVHVDDPPVALPVFESAVRDLAGPRP